MASEEKNIEAANPPPLRAAGTRRDDSLSSEKGIPTPATPARITVPEILAGYTEEEIEHKSKALVRKIDLRLLPAIVIMYILNYIDRNNIAAARLAHIEEDLNLSEDGQQFQVGRKSTRPRQSEATAFGRMC